MKIVNFMGCRNLFRSRPGVSSEDKLMVKVWFLNPYTDVKVYFVICPSHQVNMYFVIFIAKS